MISVSVVTNAGGGCAAFSCCGMFKMYKQENLCIEGMHLKSSLHILA